MESNTNKFWTIPNIITLSRIVMIPFFVWTFLDGRVGHLIAALVIVILSGISDKADGIVARKFNMISDTGKWLDPLADKLTQVALCIVMFVAFFSAEDPGMRFVAWVFMGYVGKEIFMLLFALGMMMMKITPSAAEIWGKVATLIFYIVMSVLLFAGPEVGILARAFGDHVALPPLAVQIMAVVTLAATVISFFGYIPDTYRKIMKRENSKIEE